MKLTYSIILGSIASLALTGSLFAASAEYKAKKAAKQQNIQKSLSSYKACDLTALMTELKAVQLDNSTVFKVSDQIPEENAYYYEVKDTRFGVFNTDLVKSSVCNYVMKNSCYLYWNNVMATGKIAPVALKKVRISPPVSLISPLVGCKK